VRRLVLVRHGKAVASRSRVVGHLDRPLSQAGARAVADLAASWRGPIPDLLVASDLRRAADSARLLADHLGVAAQIDPRLRELSFGQWEGMTWEQVHRRDASLLAAWSQRWWDVAPPAGETFEELSRRVLAWFADCRRRGADVVVAVVHGGSLRALLSGLVGVPRGKLFELRLDFSRVTSIEVGARSCRLAFLNHERFEP